MNREKTLEQVPCEDAVSREAVLAIAGDSCLDLDSYEDTKEFCDEIKELPSITPVHKKDEWVPCSEKLPKVNECKNNVCKYYFIQDEFGDMHVAHYTSVGWIPIDSLYAIEDKVVAWRPLPKRYKAETKRAGMEGERMTIEEAIICLNDIKTAGRNVFTSRKVFKNVLDMAIRSLEMQKKLSEFSGMDICNWIEDYDYEENNISEYEYETSVDNFLIDEVNAETEEE